MKKCSLLLFILTAFFCVKGMAGKPHSVLSSGKWYRLGVVQTGLHKITYEDFVAMGFEPSAINPANIRVFGNGGAMLPEKNSDPRPDDLTEISIKVVDGGDGVFGAGDYVIFYGEGPVNWTLVYVGGAPRFNHSLNLYSDTTFYYVTTGDTPGKRITDKLSLETTPTYYSNKFSDYEYHEAELYNYLKSGKTWLGENFSRNTGTVSFPFEIPRIDSLNNLKITLGVANLSTDTATFTVSDNHQFSGSFYLPSYFETTAKPAPIIVKQSYLISNPKHDFEVRMAYHSSSADGQAWLDNFELNFSRYFFWRGTSQMLFRDPNAIGKSCTEFRMRSAHPGIEIWDVSVKYDVRRMITINTDTTIRFRMASDSLKEYVAFDYSDFYPVVLKGAVANQDLHGMQAPKMIIVSPAIFREQAQRLADFHATDEAGFTVAIVEPQQIYNEFSSGIADPSAIRDFVKLMYDKTQGISPKYLLLFGDGSYDPKNRLPGNNNFIPAFQSKEYRDELSSFVTDDYYGLMSTGEGTDADGSLDVRIGRFPVSTEQDAKTMVDKIVRYSVNNDSTLGNWRNRIAFVADDEDYNMHFTQAEKLTKMMDSICPVFNLQKIYNDAYQMFPTAAGNRLPQVNDVISKAIEDGLLYFNYNGHGGEGGLSYEQILTIPDIQKWTNYNRLPIFVTATCEFSRFDNPERITAGEKILLHPNGGAIALFSTTRLTGAPVNFPLDSVFLAHLMSDDGSPNPRLGDLILISKNLNHNNDKIKNFVLLGDPAQKPAYPEYQVFTTSINDNSSGEVTALGLSRVRVSGEIRNVAGNKVNCAGKVTLTVFDKPTTVHTIGNTKASYPAPFNVRNAVLFKGTAPVTGGSFTFEFLIPKSVAQVMGKAKLSYYYDDGSKDGAGYDYDLIVGGQDLSVEPVNTGPGITMYMDDPTFKSGGVTQPNTTLFATIEDPEGINTLDLGLGHEITLILDGDLAHPIICNDIFRFDDFSWNSGSLTNLFTNLPRGKHTLKLTAWDLYDNSSSNEITFIVGGSSAGGKTFAYPNPFPKTSGSVHFRITRPENATAGTMILKIYDQNATLIRTLSEDFPEGIPEQTEILWDGTSSGGAKVKSGLYLYRVSLPVSGGNDYILSQKLLILN